MTKLEKSEDRYKLIFELSPQAIVVLDKKGRMVDVNDRLLDWLGYSKKEVLGKNLIRLPYIPKHSKVKVAEKFAQRMMGKKLEPYELDFVSKSGDTKVGLITGVPIKNDEGKIVEDLVMISDITYRKKVEDELAHKVVELENMNKLMINRELKMVELKDKIKKLEGK